MGWHCLAARHTPSTPSSTGRGKNKMRNLVAEVKGGDITQKLLSWAKWLGGNFMYWQLHKIRVGRPLCCYAQSNLLAFPRSCSDHLKDFPPSAMKKNRKKIKIVHPILQISHCLNAVLFSRHGFHFGCAGLCSHKMHLFLPLILQKVSLP